MNAFNFTGQVAIVTGAGGVIGRAAASALATAGSRVTAVDFDRESGEETVHLLRAGGAEAIFVQADVRRAEDVAGYVKATRVEFGGRIDHFVNNAAWQGAVSALIDYSDDVFDQVLAVNVRGVYLGLKHVLAVMVAQGSGSVVNTASIGGYIGTRDLAPYSASKHAVLGLTKSVALEVARKGIRVNAVCPGPVDTPMIRAIEARQAVGGDASLVRKKRTASIPDGRYADPEEVANLMLYLLSPLSSHVTGQGIQINGGAHS